MPDASSSDAATVDTAVDAFDSAPIPSDGSSQTHFTHVVLVSDNGYEPTVVYATRGDAIEWRWTTTTMTTVTSGVPCLADGMFASGPHVSPYVFRVRIEYVGPFLYFDDGACDSTIGGIIVSP